MDLRASSIGMNIVASVTGLSEAVLISIPEKRERFEASYAALRPVYPYLAKNNRNGMPKDKA